MTFRLFLVALFAVSLSGPVVADEPKPVSKWEKEVAAFERADLAQPPPKGALLFTGSSTIRRWTTMAQDLPGYEVINRGFGGSQIADATEFAERLIFPHAPRAVILRAGGNDLHAKKTPERVFEDFKAFVAKVRSKLPDAVIVYFSACPSIARVDETEATKALNSLVEKFCRETPNLKYLDAFDISLDAGGAPRAELFVADQLHLNEEGYKLLAARVREFLSRDFPR